ncbi:hypothetical protein AHF37_11329 [Paragonimus kellicotti]|nr:hypothetical protein AHF37_11329 [Paragonimus kellicotti]
MINCNADTLADRQETTTYLGDRRLDVFEDLKDEFDEEEEEEEEEDDDELEELSSNSSKCSCNVCGCWAKFFSGFKFEELAILREARISLRTIGQLIVNLIGGGYQHSYCDKSGYGRLPSSTGLPSTASATQMSFTSDSHLANLVTRMMNDGKHFIHSATSVASANHQFGAGHRSWRKSTSLFRSIHYSNAAGVKWSPGGL